MKTMLQDKSLSYLRDLYSRQSSEIDGRESGTRMALQEVNNEIRSQIKTNLERDMDPKPIKGHIVIVEDNKSISDSMAYFIEKEFRTMVKVASDISNAVNLLSEEDVELAIIDAYISGSPKSTTGGFDLIKLIPRKIPVILISGMAAEEDLKKAAKHYSASAYFIKPFDIKKMIKTMRMFIKPSDEQIVM